MKYPGFVGPSYTSQSKIAADDRCVNWYPEKIESGTGKNGYALYPTPGYTSVATLGDVPVRGLFAINGFGTTALLFAVGGATLYDFSGFTPTSRGTIADDANHNRVSIVTNGDAGGQLLISSGLSTHTLYAYNITSHALTTLTPAGSQVGFIDGYGLALDTATSTLQWSALEDFTTWDPLDVAQRNDAADKWGALLVHHKEAWLFGSETTSVYYNSGSDPVFQPITSVFIQCGIRAVNSAKVLNGSPVWLGQRTDGAAALYRANGYTPERISTFALEYQWSQYTNTELANADADVFQLFGHTFYKLTFPGPQTTFVYDDTTGLWFEEGDWNEQVYTGLSTWGQAYLSNANLTGSRTTGGIFSLGLLPSQVGFDSAGNLIRRLRRAPHMAQENKRIIIDRFQVDMEVGIANASGVGGDPHITGRWSKDGGQTFGNSTSVSSGKIGEYRQRVIFRRLGQGRDWVCEIAVTDPIPQRLIDAYLELRVGAS